MTTIAPDTPGALDLLDAERRSVYDRCYRSRPDDEHPTAKHAAAWRAVAREKDHGRGNRTDDAGDRLIAADTAR